MKKVLLSLSFLTLASAAQASQLSESIVCYGSVHTIKVTTFSPGRPVGSISVLGKGGAIPVEMKPLAMPAVMPRRTAIQYTSNGREVGTLVFADISITGTILGQSVKCQREVFLK